MKEIEVYEISDTGKKGANKHIAYFTLMRDADSAAKGLRSDRSEALNGAPTGEILVEPRTLMIFESYAEYTDTNETTIKAKALKKLTHREREVLGLA